MPEIEVKPEHAADPNTPPCRHSGRRRRHPALGRHHRLASRAYPGGHSPHRIERPVGLLSGQENPRKHQRRGLDRCSRASPPDPAKAAPDRRRSFRRRAREVRERCQGDHEGAQAKSRRARTRRTGRCDSTSARDCSSSGWCCARCIFLARNVFFRSSAYWQPSPGSLWGFGVGCFDEDDRAWRLRSCASLAAAGTSSASRGGGRRARAAPRVEARSADLLAVGTVQGDRMTVHLSRIVDNAPMRRRGGRRHAAGGHAILRSRKPTGAIPSRPRIYAARRRIGRISGDAGRQARGAQRHARFRSASRGKRTTRGAPGSSAGGCSISPYASDFCGSGAGASPPTPEDPRPGRPKIPATLEALHRLHEHLEPRISGNAFEGKREVDMQYVAEAAAGIAQP